MNKTADIPLARELRSYCHINREMGRVVTGQPETNEEAADLINELYEALDNLLDDLGPRVVGFDDKRVVRTAEMALAKARGEKP